MILFMWHREHFAILLEVTSLNFSNIYAILAFINKVRRTFVLLMYVPMGYSVYIKLNRSRNFINFKADMF